MIRLAELAMFVAPVLALLAWRAAAARGMDGPPPRQLALMLAGLVAIESALVLIAVRDRMPPGQYVPAIVRNGQIVPGHIEPANPPHPAPDESAPSPLKSGLPGMDEFRIDPPPFLADSALKAVLAALPSARLVGGAVRDAVAGRPVADIDLATPLHPEAVIAALSAAGLKHAPTGLRHGTVTAISRGRGFEVTTLRRDEATDGRHATVAWTEDWQQDAARRDFTINAMSMRPDSRVSDYFGGRADLAAGRVRFVGDPAARIAEDHLRVLRYFRFQGRYGATPPDAATAAALRHGASMLARLSVERVWSEVKRILAIPSPLPTLHLMQSLGVLDAALPGGADLPALDRLVAAGAPPDPLLRLAALGPAPTIADRLKLSRAEAATLAALAGPVPDPSGNDGALRRALAETPAAALIGRAWLAGAADPAWAALRARLAAMPRPAFPLAGRDAVALGIPPGPRVGAALDAVRTWWMAGGCTAGHAACRAELARHAAP